MQELNYWTELSIQYANQKSYLDDLFQVYSISKKEDLQTNCFFEKWLNKKALGILPVNLKTFIKDNQNAILENKEGTYKIFCKKYLNYTNSDKIDFIARFNEKNIIGKVEVILDSNEKQITSSIKFLKSTATNFEKIVIVDTIPSFYNQKEIEKIRTSNNGHNIMSILVLREFLYQI